MKKLLAYRVGDKVGKAIVLAYEEPTSDLENALAQEGFAVQTIRASYTPEELEFSRAFRCLLNHRSAWQQVAASTEWHLVCEADFVPCRGLAGFRLPIPWELSDRSWAYLYTGAGTVYRSIGGYIHGVCAPTVAYLVGPEAARAHLRFFDWVSAKEDPTKYFSWEAWVAYHAIGQGVLSFLSPRCLGEHGGLPNPEHRENRMNPNHQADVLAGPLHFLPRYAKGSRWRYRRIRARAKLKGVARYLLNRWFSDQDVYPVSGFNKLEIYWIGLRRLFSIH